VRVCGCTLVCACVCHLCACFPIGIAFWKSPSRKIFAVEFDQLRGKARKPPNQPQHNSATSEDVPAEQVMVSISAMRKDIQALQACTWGKTGSFPPALKQNFIDCLKCKICQSAPFRPPIILAKCCSNIVGCQTCVDAWFSGTDALVKPCPICKCTRGYAQTTRLHGMDELCEALEAAKLLSDNIE
jgi:hypothetical protein